MLARSPPLFVVGTGRCGSTLLGRMLDVHAQLACIHEFFTALGDERAFEDATAKGEGVKRELTTPDPDAIALMELGVQFDEMRPSNQAHERFGSDIPRALLAPLPHLFPDSLRAYDELEQHLASLARAPFRQAVDSILRWMTLRAGKQAWVERSGSSGRYFRRVLAAWPEAKVIHIHRAGPACALSMSRHPYHRILMARRAKRDPGLSVAECLRMALPLDRYGAYWSAVTWSISGALRQLGKESVVHVRYEELVAEPDRCLEVVERKLMAWGLPADPKWRASARLLIRRQPLQETIESSLSKSCRPGRMALEDLIA